ncbi:MAG: CoA transferase [Chloroflexi bacterium]|nr:CoA transferase [Chloroflexota bacterium]
MEGALAGLRVLDFTWVLAGPSSTRFLADHGAQIIKVEQRGTGDRVRQAVLADAKPGVNRGGYFNCINRGKLSITLNMGDPRAQGLVRRLVPLCDIVVDNFRPGIMERWGLDYENLRRLRPDIIALSLSGMGRTGPYAGYGSFGPNLQALSGITYLTGFPWRDPVGFGYSYSDYTGGWAGALAMLQALHYRRRTGQGQFVDLSQLEALLPMLGVGLMDLTVNGRQATRAGNRLPGQPAAPHGAYRCRGDDQWCVIAVFTPAEWEAFCRALGNPPWAVDPKFASVTARVQHQDELDRLVEEWTGQRTPDQVMEHLQSHGVAAAAVREAPDLIDRDPQLREFGFWVEADHPELGRRLYEGMPFKLSETPGAVRRGSPLLGEHNDLVFGELLGLSPEEIAGLKKAEVI